MRAENLTRHELERQHKNRGAAVVLAQEVIARLEREKSALEAENKRLREALGSCHNAMQLFHESGLQPSLERLYQKAKKEVGAMLAKENNDAES